MRITIANLRKMIREEVERNLRWTAGIAARGAGLNQAPRGVTYGVPQGLGSETDLDLDKEEKEKERYEEEESSSGDE